MTLKKLSAILLFALLLFNLAGYRIWFYYAQMQSDQQLETSFDNNNYNENDLIAIKIPLVLPYQTNWKDFERVNGEVTLNGKIYKYVKRKLYDGELILLCLPDENKMRLQTARDDFFKFANDLQQNSSSKKSGNPSAGNFKNIISDFDKQFNEAITSSFIENIEYCLPQNIHSLISRAHSSPEQPPEIIKA
ncbi:MAG: hypothetical protein ACR2FN_14375 [Chitinophagaceae bacterium]